MDCREAFENWVKDHNDAPIKWIGHSYANAYMAAQWEGFNAAYNSRADQTAKETVEGLAAPPCEDLETVKAGLEEIRTMVQYINSQTVFATMTENSDGPKAIMPLPQEAWDILLAVGKKSHEALAALGRVRGE